VSVKYGPGAYEIRLVSERDRLEQLDDPVVVKLLDYLLSKSLMGRVEIPQIAAAGDQDDSTVKPRSEAFL
jgi:hypothetical protein